MKLSQYAKKVDVTYRTAFQWWKDGQIKGYQVVRSVKEIGSGLTDNRPQFLALLQDQSITTIEVEHTERATRFGFRYLQTFLQMQMRRLEVVNLAETSREDVLADLTSVIYSSCAKLYGQHRAKIKAEAVLKQVEET